MLSNDHMKPPSASVRSSDWGDELRICLAVWKILKLNECRLLALVRHGDSIEYAYEFAAAELRKKSPLPGLLFLLRSSRGLSGCGISP